MSEVIVGIGVPGSGKTTVLKAIAKERSVTYLNADDIRESITGDPADHSHEDEVWRRLYSSLATALQRDTSVIVDATHSKVKDRRNLINFCHEHGATKIIGYYMDVPLEVSLKRNAARARKVPEPAVRRMHERLQMNPPDKSEGFDEILRIRSDAS